MMTRTKEEDIIVKSRFWSMEDEKKEGSEGTFLSFHPLSTHR